MPEDLASIVPAFLKVWRGAFGDAGEGSGTYHAHAVFHRGYQHTISSPALARIPIRSDDQTPVVVTTAPP